MWVLWWGVGSGGIFFVLVGGVNDLSICIVLVIRSYIVGCYKWIFSWYVEGGMKLFLNCCEWRFGFVILL